MQAGSGQHLHISLWKVQPCLLYTQSLCTLLKAAGHRQEIKIPRQILSAYRNFMPKAMKSDVHGLAMGGDSMLNTLRISAAEREESGGGV